MNISGCGVRSHPIHPSSGEMLFPNSGCVEYLEQSTGRETKNNSRSASRNQRPEGCGILANLPAGLLHEPSELHAVDGPTRARMRSRLDGKGFTWTGSASELHSQAISLEVSTIYDCCELQHIAQAMSTSRLRKAVPCQ